MKKVKFRNELIQLDKKRTTSIKVLETPTLLKRLLLTEEISLEEYTKKTNTYFEAIKLKYSDKKAEKENKRLRDYQQKNVSYIKNLKSFGIHDDMRTGKTPTVIEIVKAKNLIDEKIIIICPGKVISNWQIRLKEWANKESQIYEGKKIKENILIVSYQRARLSLEKLLKFKPKVAILDEAHILRNSKGIYQRLNKNQQKIFEEKNLYPINKAILKIGKIATHRYTLSGTPSVNNSKDIFAILQFIMPNVFSSFWNFAYYYFSVKFSYAGIRIISEEQTKRQKGELQELLDYCTTSYKKEEVMPWLKKAKEKTVNLELSKIQKELMENLIELSQIGDKFILNTLSSYSYARQIALSPLLIQKLTGVVDLGSKVEYVLDFIEENQGLNIGIFTTSGRLIQKIKKLIEKEFKNKRILEITQKTKKPEVIKIQNIINEKSIKNDIIFLGTNGVCKEGISLEGLKKAVIMDKNWIQTDLTQLLCRLDSTTEEAQEFFGEKEFTLLHIPGSIDDIIQETLDKKKSRTAMINDYKEFLKKRRIKNG